jgi:hypothetical protein
MSVVVAVDDRREEARIAVGLRAVLTYRDGSLIWTEADAGVADLSRGGMYVLCDRCPNLGQRILFRLSSHRGACAATGHPVHFRGHGGFGVRFAYVNQEMLALLRDLRSLSASGQARAMAVITDAQISVC